MKKLFSSLFVLNFLILTAQEKPNIIIIFTDDQGYADIGVHDIRRDIKTPNIDALANDGVTFTSGYVTAPQCAPSRAGLMTGRYNQRIGFGSISEGPLALKELTIAERLKKLGYFTGQVGKWHLEPNFTNVKWAQKNHSELIQTDKNGKRVHLDPELVQKFYPGNQGFDEFFTGELHNYWSNFSRNGKSLNPKGEYLNISKEEFRVDIQTDAALAFIDRNINKPFFLYLAYYAPHVPLRASEKYLSRFPGDMPERRRTALAMMSAVDDGVGKIQKKLRDNKLYENTIIFFISDNGAPLGAQNATGPKADIRPVDKVGPEWDGSLNEPLTGEKGMLMEGGIRVPFVVSWPKKLPIGIKNNDPVITLDVAATCLTAAGIEVPQELDGIDLMSVASGDNIGTRTLYWRFWNQASIREGDWKYLTMANGKEYLFNLKDDLEEDNNFSNQRPDIAKRLKNKLLEWSQEMEPKGLPNKHLLDQEVNWYKHYLKD